MPVAWPGRAATPRDVTEFSKGHHGMTIITACGSWIFGVLPGAALLANFDVDTERPVWAAAFCPGTALMK